MTQNENPQGNPQRKIPTSTIINFLVLIILFTAVFLFQRFGNKIISNSSTTQPPQETAAAPAPEGKAEDTAAKAEADKKPPASETAANVEKPQKKRSRKDIKSLIDNNSEAAKEKTGLEYTVTVEELDSEAARQNYLATSKAYPKSVPSGIANPEASNSSPRDDFIPFEGTTK